MRMYVNAKLHSHAIITRATSQCYELKVGELVSCSKNSFRRVFGVYLGRIRKVHHIDYAIHLQTSGYQKQVQKTARNAFRLEV